MNSAFLGYSFSADELQHPSKDDNFDLYCVFDQSLRYRLLSPRYSEEFPGNPYSELRYIVNDVPKDDAEEDNDTKYEYILGKEKQELSDLMDMYYPQSVNGGKGIVVDETNIKKYRARFKALPSDANIITYWNALTSSMQSGYGGCKVALVLKRDQESPQKSYYYIHAEPKN